MVHIFFIGSPAVSEMLGAVLAGYADIAPVEQMNICVCEVSSAQDISKIPSKLTVPLFLFINTKDKHVLDMIRRFRISGILYSPLDGEMLKRKIDAAIKRSETLPAGSAGEHEDFEKIKVKIYAKAESIPMLPVFVHKLITLTTSDSVTVSALTAEIKKDQGISGRVIRIVNSPFYGLSQQVNSIDRAVVLLGPQTLKSIALAASTGSYYNKQFKMFKTTGNILWAHAYTVAMLCEAMAEEAGLDTGLLYLAGLFHDIGKTIILDFLVKEVSNLADERGQVGMDHAEVGALVMRKWQLADEIVNAVKLHHYPDNAPATRILYNANRFAHGVKRGQNIIDKVFSDIMADIPIKDPGSFKAKLLAIAKSGEEVAM